MNAKEQKIKEAYGEYGDIALQICGENGWIKINEYHSYFPKDNEKSPHGQFRRPKSLQGIEDNNGWIRIESGNDLPKETGWFEFQSFPQEKYTPERTLWHADSKKIGWWKETYTHYRKIDIDKPPIY